MFNFLRELDWKNFIWPLALVAVLVLNIYPFVWMIIGSVWDEDKGFHWENFIEAFVAFDFGTVFLNTLYFTLGSTLIGMVLGTLVAVAVARTNISGKRFIRYLSILGFVSPPWITAMGYVFLLGPRAGIVNRFLEGVFNISPFNIYTIYGMIFVGSLFIYSLVFILISKALENIDSSFEECALVSGASKFTTILRITLPLIKPSLITAGVFSLISGFAMFAVPAILGMPERIYVFATQLYRLITSFPPDLGVSAAIAVLFTLLAVVVGTSLIWYQNRLIAGQYEVVGVKGRRRGDFQVSYQWLLTAFCFAVVILALVIPYSSVLIMSFSETGYLHFSLEDFSLDNYRYLLFDYGNMWPSVRNTLLLGVASGLGALVLCSVIAYIQVRTRVFYRNFLSLATFFPLVVPSSALVIGFTWAWIRPPFALYGTIWLIVLCMIARWLPLSTRNVTDGLQQVNESLEEASYVCGGSWLRTFYKITIPLMKPVLTGTFLIVFLSSVRDLLIPVFLGGGTEATLTMSVAAYTFWGFADLGPATAMSVLLVVLTLAVYIPMEKYISTGI